MLNDVDSLNSVGLCKIVYNKNAQFKRNENNWNIDIFFRFICFLSIIVISRREFARELGEKKNSMIFLLFFHGRLIWVHYKFILYMWCGKMDMYTHTRVCVCQKMKQNQIWIFFVGNFFFFYFHFLVLKNGNPLNFVPKTYLFLFENHI